MSTSVLLFYSSRCPHSKQFLEETQKSGIQDFHKVCLDNTPRERIPAVVKSVPALVFAGTNQCLQGEQAFQWLNQQMHAKHQHAQQKQQQQVSSTSNSMNDGNEPSAWQMTEMGSSFSDTYSFIDNSFTESGQIQTNNGGSGSTIPKNFAFLSNDSVSSQASAAVQSHMQPQPSHTNNIQQNAQIGMRGGLPNGSGSMPPNISMSSPQMCEKDDELSKRMQQLQSVREEEVPQQFRRMS